VFIFHIAVLIILKEACVSFSYTIFGYT